MSSHIKQHGERISKEKREAISMRYHTITSAVNKEFWGLSSSSENSLYVGSYGRGTAIETSDIDVMIVLPETEYDRYDLLKGNSQSRLLQAVRKSILDIYPRSDIRADGQVVKVSFSDGMRFEILPVFKNKGRNGPADTSYQYPDTNMGGNWCSTDPKAEQNAMRKKNESSNGLLFDTCKHIRYVHDNQFNSYKLAGIVIDSFAYYAIGDWEWPKSNDSPMKSDRNYEHELLDWLKLHQIFGDIKIEAPGSKQTVPFKESIDGLEKVLKYIVE